MAPKGSSSGCDGAARHFEGPQEPPRLDAPAREAPRLATSHIATPSPPGHRNHRRAAGRLAEGTNDAAAAAANSASADVAAAASAPHAARWGWAEGWWAAKAGARRRGG